MDAIINALLTILFVGIIYLLAYIIGEVTGVNKDGY